MAKAVEFRINIKSEDGGVLKRLPVEADGLDDILSEVGNTAVRYSRPLDPRPQRHGGRTCRAFRQF